MADVIMKLAELHLPQNNFSMFNITTVRMREHERDGFLIGNNCEMAFFKKLQPFAYCLDYCGCFFLNSGIPLFTSRKSLRHKGNWTTILWQHSSQRKVRCIRLNFKGYADLNRAQTGVTWIILQCFECHHSFVAERKGLAMQENTCFLWQVRHPFSVMCKQTRHSF